MELNQQAKEFLDYCKKARECCLSMSDPLLVHHYDTDGISAAAIIVSAFLKKDKNIRRLCLKKLDNDAIDRLKAEKEIIFADLGSGNPKIEELNADVVIIDHHQTLKVGVKYNVNPLLFGLSGESELSASGTSYLVFKEKAELAIVGAIADQQYPLVGMNRYVLEQAVAERNIKIERDVCFYGRYCRPLVQFLAFSDDPYIPGITFREDKAITLFSTLGISLKTNEKWRTYSDLSAEEKNRLISAIVDILSSNNMSHLASGLFDENYVFPNNEKNETYEAKEFSSLLNALGRNGKDGDAIDLCLGKNESYKKATELLQIHRTNIRKGIEFALTNVSDFGIFYFIDGREIINESIIGIVCGIIIQQLSQKQKPIIGVSIGENGSLKFSGRGTQLAIKNGLNLGLAMKEAAHTCGGIGGGHKIAAGASINSDRINEFLISLSNSINGH